MRQRIFSRKLSGFSRFLKEHFSETFWNFHALKRIRRLFMDCKGYFHWRTPFCWFFCSLNWSWYFTEPTKIYLLYIAFLKANVGHILAEKLSFCHIGYFFSWSRAWMLSWLDTSKLVLIDTFLVVMIWDSTLDTSKILKRIFISWYLFSQEKSCFI